MTAVTAHRETESATDGYDFGVVVVCYRSRHHVTALLELWPADLRVVIVDNGSDVDGVRAVVDAHPNATYLDGMGVGYSRAANMGAVRCDSAFVVFVNPDSRPTVTQLQALISGLRNDPTSASHAATVTTPGGRPEIGVGGWEPTVPRALMSSLGLNNIWRRAGLYARPRPGEDLAPQWTTGACMAVRMDVFRQLGGFDERFFLYSEDVAFGRAVRAAGFRQVLRPDVTVAHSAGGSGAPSKEMHRVRGASFANYLDTQPLHRRVGVLALTTLGFVLRAVVAGIRGRPQLARLHAGYIQGILTRTAHVGGREVARSRHLEVTGHVSGADVEAHRGGRRLGAGGGLPFKGGPGGT
ncbi:MAG: glycosyltransferase family 2 protein [Candidatus Phosphoribacter sp.]